MLVDVAYLRGHWVHDSAQGRHECARGHLQAPGADRLDAAVEVRLGDVVRHCFVCLHGDLVNQPRCEPVSNRLRTDVMGYDLLSHI